ncbi:unnamed protein product, partial [Ranitomeya imitator]
SQRLDGGDDEDVSLLQYYSHTCSPLPAEVDIGNPDSKQRSCKLRVTESFVVLCQFSMSLSRVCLSVDDLMKYLDPQYIDRIAVPDAMKLEFILAEEPYILSQAALLEQLHSLQPLLDSEHIKAVPAQASKLQTLSQVHIKQQDQSEEVTAESKRLLEDYNKMTLLLSKQFVMWDEVLSQIEAAQQVKPRSE